ncbi:MAG TPA: class II glutamine amidotransferase, partial [Clostridia bacterium]|nr:class II glutamine amidotransferase [Clostridia bacterium]
MDKLHEECGVIGIYNKDENAVWSVWEGLFALQHRGQESAGIAVYSDNTIHCERGMGLVNEALCSETVKRLPSSRLGIGHVRYSTAGESSANNVQPMFARFSGGWIAIAHNGNLINTEALEQQLLDEGEYFQTSSDSGVLMALIIRNARNVSIEESIMHTMRDMVKGSYALVITTQDKLIGVRDPLGIRPLVLGRTRDGGWCLASESCAIDIIGAELVRDIAPGEMVVLEREGIKEHKFADTKKSALC